MDESDSAAARARPRPRRRLWIGLAIACVALLLLWSAAWFYVPPLLASAAENAVAQQLGRRLSLGHVVFNPWTLELTIDDIAVAAAVDGAPPLLEVKRIHADAAIVSLFRLAPVIDALEIEQPMLRVGRTGEGRYDIDDILQKLASAPPSSEPARFALHNITVRGGGADLVDRPLATTHRLRDLALGVPFVSSLPSQREIKVEPHLAFALDGSRFDSAGAATPFAERGNGELHLKLEGFSVAPYLGYLPRGLPAQLRSATLGADLVVAFEQRPKLSLKISGSVGARGIEVVDAVAHELLQVGSVQVAIDELRPLEQVVRLKAIDIDAPHLVAARNAAGHVNLLLAGAAPSGATTPVARVPVPSTRASGSSAAGSASASSSSTSASASASGSGSASVTATAPAAPQWQVTVAALAVHAGKLDWRDATTSPAAELGLDAFSFGAEKIGWPLAAPVVFKGEGSLGAGGERGRLAFSGQGDTTSATVKLSLAELPIAPFRPYLRSVLVPPLAGAVSADATMVWHAGDGAPRLQLDARRLSIARLVLGEVKTPEVALDEIELVDTRVDTVARTAAIGRLALRAPRLRIERDAQHRWAFERWSASASASDSASSSSSSSSLSSSTRASASASGSASDVLPIAAASAAAAAGSSPAAAGRATAAASAPGRSSAATAVAATPWKLSLGELAIERGRVAYSDRGLAVPVALDVLDLGVQLRGWAMSGTAPAPFRVTARLAVPAGPSGKAVGAGVVGGIDVRGSLKGFDGGVPTGAQAALLLKDLPLHLLDPYLDDLLNIDVQKAQTSFKGDLRWERRSAGAALALRGDATVDDFRATSQAADGAAPRRALAMVADAGSGRQLLAWKSLSLRGIDLALAPGEPMRLGVAETALSDFFARVVLDENGHLNLQDVARPTATSATATPATTTTTAVAMAASPAASTPPAASGPAPIVRFGPIAVVNGRVAYNDRFVKPNYNANLSELTGKLGAFSSQAPASGAPPQLADLELRGRVEGTASLDITGQVNPLARPLALDLKARVRDLELPPLSPYAIKYSGYGIERGKMSVDLAYLVKPDGQLTASNKIVLNQLAFGDKVEGSTASLPVKLAVALLADRHGVIDLDLPVSGSINDPQFSLGGLIWKVITNLVVKAVTAPFSLLASAFGGGGSELSRVEFAPGTAALDDGARASLDKIAQALADRPALALTVTGESRLESERDAWKKERLKQIVRAEKRRQAIAGGADASAEVGVSEAEYPALLKEVYKRADIVKPKNVIGFAKDLPTAEMEALLLASITIADDAMQQLAVRRGVAVRDYLASKQIPIGRLFLGAPKVASDEASWTPRADLKLAAN